MFSQKIRNHYRILFTLLLILDIWQGLAQQPFIRWQTCDNHGGYNNDRHKYLILPNKKGYYIASSGYFYTISPLPLYELFKGIHDIMLIKLDSSGNELWWKTMGGSQDEEVVQLADAGGGAFYILGITTSSDGAVQSGNKGKHDIWLIKSDTAGNILWEKTYGSPGTDIPVGIYVYQDKSFLIAANIWESGGDVDTAYGDCDIWLFKCDSLGKIQWQKTLGASGLNEATDFIVNSHGNLVITGTNQNDYFSDCYYPPNQSIILFEYNMQADKILWKRCYGSWEFDYGGVVASFGDGYLFAGRVTGDGEYVEGIYHLNPYTPFRTSDIWIVKTDNRGLIEWQKCLGGIRDDIPIILFTDEAGDFYMFASTKSDDYDVIRIPENKGDNFDVWMVKFRGDGKLIYAKTFGGKNDDELMGKGSVVMSKDEKNFIVAAGSKSSLSGDVGCELPFYYKNLWLTEIGRCVDYEPGTPRRPLGDSIVYIPWRPVSEYKIDPPENAWTFQWKVEPEGAAEIRNMGLRAQLRWKAEHSGLVKVYARACNICGCGDWSAPLFVMAGGGSGTETAGRGMQIEVGPNPTRGKVKFRMPVGGLYRITITDIGGAVMAYAETQQAEWEWDGSQHRAGMYLYRVESSAGVLNGKFVVVK